MVVPASQLISRPTVRRARERIEASLRDMVVEGALNPGGKLNERALAAELGTSRTPLREAMLQLEREGLVRSDLRRGFTVQPLSSQEVREIYPMIARLECLAVEEGAALLTSLVPSLKRLNVAFSRTRSPRSAHDLDTEFHETLMSGSLNVRLADLVAALRRSIRRYELVYMSEKDLMTASVAQHDQIIAAIDSEDLAKTIAAIENNYAFGMQSVLAKMARD